MPYARGRTARGAEKRSEIGAFRLPRTPTLPTLRLKPTFTKGPRFLQRATGTTRQRPVYPAPPANFLGTTPEWAVFWALSVPLKLLPGIDFSYQASFLGGRKQFGGLVTDFIVYAPRIAINVQGIHWHYERPAQKAIDEFQRVLLDTVYGLQLIFIDEDQLTLDPTPAVRDALNGIDRSRLGSRR